MRRWWSYSLFVLAVVVTIALLFETKRLAELVGHWEVAARTERRDNQELAGRLATESAGRTAAAAEAARLAAELTTAAAQLQGITVVLGERTEQFSKARAIAEAAAARTLQPMSEGVRTCLQTLHECLRAEGFASQRFVSARSLDAEGLHEVEMFDIDGDGLGVTFVYAGRMVAELDRAAASLVLRFFEGQRFAGGERVALPDDGWRIVLKPVNGRMLEQRLPYLLHCDGVYPDAAGPTSSSSTDVDPMTRRQWLERLDRLLARAGTVQDLRVGRFRGMAGGCFLQAELIGTDQRHRVLSSAHCARLAVEVDTAAGVVSLLLHDGVLRSGGVESTITGEGYRMLLPNLNPRQASDVMFGMVVTR